MIQFSPAVRPFRFLSPVALTASSLTVALLCCCRLVAVWLTLCGTSPQSLLALQTGLLLGFVLTLSMRPLTRPAAAISAFTLAAALFGSTMLATFAMPPILPEILNVGAESFRGSSFVSGFFAFLLPAAVVAIATVPIAAWLQFTMADLGTQYRTSGIALGGLLTKMNASRRVLIVDLDLRRANLAVAFGVGKDRGGTIDEYLMGTKTLDQCVRRHEISGVDYICARPDTPNAPEILESHAMKAALATFAERYDLVILDGPPVMAVSDARIISQLADYTIFIVHWAKTARDVVTTAVGALLNVTDRVGIVINKVNLTKHALYEYGDYGDYYSRYHGYYSAGGSSSSASSASGTSPLSGMSSSLDKLKRIVPRVVK